MSGDNFLRVALPGHLLVSLCYVWKELSGHSGDELASQMEPVIKNIYNFVGKGFSTLASGCELVNQIVKGYPGAK